MGVPTGREDEFGNFAERSAPTLVPKFFASILLGAPLWVLVIIVVMTTAGGMGRPQNVSLIPGYIYSYVVGGIYFTAKVRPFGISALRRDCFCSAFTGKHISGKRARKALTPLM